MTQVVKNSIVNLRFSVSTSGQGLFDFTHKVADMVVKAGLSEGLVTLFLQHTSASLLVQENADPSAQQDLERWLDRLVPELDPLYTHVAEGPDDMPAHIKAALTVTQVSIPVMQGQLALGTWQGIFLWEHRHRGSERSLIASLQGEMEPSRG